MCENVLSYFQLYVGLKLHFNNKDYDFFKFKGRNRNINISTVRKRNDYGIFCSLVKKYNKIEFIEILLSNLLTNNTLYIGDLYFNSDTEETYHKWKKKQINIYQTIESEVNDMAILLKENKKKMPCLFSTVNCDYPSIFRMMRQNIITLETYISHDICFGFMGKFDKTYKDDIIVKDSHLIIRKYQPFLSLEKRRLIDIFKQSYF